MSFITRRPDSSAPVTLNTYNRMPNYILQDAKKQTNITAICIESIMTQGERQNKMDNLLGSDSNIGEKCHLLESGLSYRGDLCQVKLQQNGDENSESCPWKGGPWGSGWSSFKPTELIQRELEPQNKMKGSVGRSLHRQCCNVRNATQCHLKPTGTVPGLLVHRPGKNSRALLKKASSCNSTRVKRKGPATHVPASRCIGREEAQWGLWGGHPQLE